MKDPADYWDDYCEMQHNEEKRKQLLEEDNDYLLEMYCLTIETNEDY